MNLINTISFRTNLGYGCDLHCCALIVHILIFLSPALSAQPFITTWKTDNEGESADNQIMIPGTGSNYDIVWEESGNPANNGTAIGNDTTIVTFPNPGIYLVSISEGAGTFTRINFDNGGDKLKFLTIDQWGDIPWNTMETAFTGCKNLTSDAIDAPDLSSVSSTSGMFRDCVSFNGAIMNWDVSNVTTMTAMFRSDSMFNQNIGSWDVSNVTDMGSMFQRAVSFNQDLSNWDVSNVYSMNGMFASARSFNQDISNWDMSGVIFMTGMFANAVAFNRNISGWDVSNVQDMFSTFEGASSFNQDISSWNVSNVFQMNAMFRSATAFNQDLGGWRIDSVMSMGSMFDYSGLSTHNYDKTLIGWAGQQVQSGVVIGADGITYCNSVEAREFLDEIRHWTFFDDEFDCSTVRIEEIFSEGDNRILSINRPNPFDLSTTIEFRIPNAANVEIRVVDLAGNHVQTLLNGRMPSGSHEVVFEGEGLPIGVYFYFLIVDTHVKTGRMILLK